MTGGDIFIVSSNPHVFVKMHQQRSADKGILQTAATVMATTGISAVAVVVTAELRSIQSWNQGERETTTIVLSCKFVMR